MSDGDHRIKCTLEPRLLCHGDADCFAQIVEQRPRCGLDQNLGDHTSDLRIKRLVGRGFSLDRRRDFSSRGVGGRGLVLGIVERREEFVLCIAVDDRRVFLQRGLRPFEHRGRRVGFESIERHTAIDRGNDVLRPQEMPIEVRDIVISTRKADVRDRLGRICEKVACLRNSDFVDKINEILTAVLLEESRECRSGHPGKLGSFAHARLA